MHASLSELDHALLQLCVTGCISTLGKSLLTNQVKQVVQEKLAEDLAVLQGMAESSHVLTTLIRFTLLQLNRM